MIVKSPFEDVHIPKDLPLPEYVLQRTDKYGDRPALIDPESGRTVTFRDVRNCVRMLSGGLVSIGLNKGDVVSIVAPNSIDYLLLFYAILDAGGIVSTSNPRLKAEELLAQIQLNKARFVFTVQDCHSMVSEVTAQCQHVEKVFTMDNNDEFTRMCSHPAAKFQLDSNFDASREVAAIMFTSGTTGKSKGAMMSHDMYIGNNEQMSHPAFECCGPEHVMVAALPFFHLYGQLVYFGHALCKGTTLVVMGKYNFTRLLELIQKYRVSTLSLVPPMIFQLANCPNLQDYDLSSLKIIMTAGAPCSIEIIQRLMGRMELDFRDLHGMTEGACMVQALAGDAKAKPGSVGLPFQNNQVKITDIKSRETLPVHETGEICVKGPTVMLGYYKDPEATRHTIDQDGWLHTGDLGYLDNDGYLFVVGRLKELIKYKGNQVSPPEMDELLLKHPDVADAAVVGVPDEEAGELPRAFIVKVMGSSVTESDIQKFVREHAAPHKQLRGGVIFMDSIPKSPSGKILRQELKKYQNLDNKL